MQPMDSTRGSSWQPSMSLDRASVDAPNESSRVMPASSRGGETMRRRDLTDTLSEDGTESSRGRQRPTPENRAREQAMWPNPWMRRHWDPENPLDLNKPVHDDNAPLDSDDLESRTFQPAFAMDLNDLVKSLWTPKLPPPPSPTMRPGGKPRDMLQTRRQRSGSPMSVEMPSSVRDVRRHVPAHDERRSVDVYEFQSRERQTPLAADQRMSADMASWSRHAPRQPTRGRDQWQYEEELRSRRAQPGPRYEDMSSRRQQPQRRPDPSRDFDLHQQSRRRAPQDTAHDLNRGYSSEDSVRGPAYHELPVAGRRDPFTMDAREAAEAAAMARFSQDRMDRRGMDPRVQGPQLRRVVSAPPSHLLRPDRHHEPRYHDDERSGQAPARFLSAHPTLARAQSDGYIDDEQGYEV